MSMTHIKGLGKSVGIPLFGILTFIALAAYLYSSKSTAQDASNNSFILNNGTWEQVVLPGNPGGSTVRSLFGDDLTADDYGQTWIIYTFDGAANSYANPGIDGSIAQGQGFWMIQITGSDVEIDVPVDFPGPLVFQNAACSSPSGCAVLQLATRDNNATWNMLGSPFPNSIPTSDIRIVTNATDSICSSGCSLDEASSQGLIGSELWHYNSAAGQYDDKNAMGSTNPMQGFWMKTENGSDGSDPALLVPKAEDDDGLPPDPGEAGKATLEGIDSDGDGVRDDVQRWIVLENDNDLNLQNALKQNAKTMSLLLINSDDKEKSLLNMQNEIDDFECLHYTLGYNRDGFHSAMDIDDEIEAIFYNTKDRVKARLSAQKHAIARVGSENLSFEETIQKAGTLCDFSLN